MAVKDRVTIELYVDDQGTIQIVNARKAVQELGEAGKQSQQNAASGADDFASALVQQLGIYAAVTAAAYKLEQVVVDGFKAGIQAVDEYRLTTIGVAATLTDLAQNQDNLGLTYARNLAYSKDMYQELELAAARHFASGKEGVQAWNILTQKGIVLQKEQIDDLFIIVDKIKLATAGQVQGIQISQELRAMLNGQARATDQLAMMVKDRYGSAWQDIINKHREAGDLIGWLAGEFKGLQYASQDVQGTLTSQKTTLETLLTQVGRAGLGGAFEDIVSWLRQANDYLRTHREEIGGEIARGWKVVKDLAEGTYGFIKLIAAYANFQMHWEIKIASIITGPAAKWLASGAEGGTYTVGGILPGDPKASNITIPPDASFGFGAMLPQQGIGLDTIEFKNRQNQALADAAAKYKSETYGLYAKSLGPDKTKPFQAEAPGGGSGKSTDSALNSMQTLMDRLQQDISKLSEGGRAAVDAWATHTENDINKLVAKGADGSEALVLLERAKSLKMQAINDEIYQHIAQQSGNAYAAIEADSNKWLQKAGGDINQIMALWDIKSRKEWEADVKNYESRLNLNKSFYDQAAQLDQNLTDQINDRRGALNAEIEIHRYQLGVQLNQLLVAKQITAAERDRYLANQALLDQQKKFDFEMKNDKGLAGWAYGRQQEINQRNPVKDMMSGAELWIGDNFGKMAYGSMTGQKQQFQKLWQDIMSSAVTWAFKNDAKILGDLLAHGINGQGQGGKSGGGISYSGGSGGGSGGYQPGWDAGSGATPQDGAGTNNTYDWNAVAGHWEKVATQNQGAGEGLSMAGAQGVTAAAGMALAGIGMLTGSQILVEAGTALSAVASIMMIVAVMQSWKILHGGGLIAHSGMLVAHGGLALDERLILAQTGEGILQRSAMSAYAAMGIGFDDLNNGRLPMVYSPVAGNFTTPAAQQKVEHHYHDNRTVKPTIVISQKITRAEADDLWRNILQPAMEKNLGRKG